jgi:hypothetical protein
MSKLIRHWCGPSTRPRQRGPDLVPSTPVLFRPQWLTCAPPFDQMATISRPLLRGGVR